MSGKRRIMTEIFSHLSGKYNSIITEPTNTFYNTHKEQDYIDFFNVYDDDKLVKIRIIFKNTSYPFSPPKIEINNIKLKDFLKLNHSFFKNYNKYLKTNLKCFCTCCHIPIFRNWSPSYMTSDILNNIDKHLVLKKRVINIILLKNIMLKKIGYIIPDMLYFI